MKVKTRRMWLGGNWKMNGQLQANTQFFQSFEQSEIADIEANVDMVIFPSALHCLYCQELAGNLAMDIGAQNFSEQDSGAYTGDISTQMLVDGYIDWVLIGHSERREYHNETDALLKAKLFKALDAGLKPVFCIGESLEVRKAGNAKAHIENQLVNVLTDDVLEQLNDEFVIAYEPIWAIGTGEAATPEQAQDIHQHIRKFLAEKSKAFAESVRIVYGGSIKPGNAEEILAMDDIDGGLVGGASLQAQSFLSICQAANAMYL